ncbi:hypothetical protein M758_9G073300, partial [Ceratodon purpureus]
MIARSPSPPSKPPQVLPYSPFQTAPSYRNLNTPNAIPMIITTTSKGESSMNHAPIFLYQPTVQKISPLSHQVRIIQQTMQLVLMAARNLSAGKMG